ncbi:MULTISPECIES: hypothetical protein [Bacillus amyloliquefaciens group]|uniref:hypothetical protein n=1 Tax=Bacillus amyloliquefaciens group TaxID=1938374 RepID=UPI00073CCADE|nr:MULTISPECIES: hypothetical protein [Bacillus amyloliquefaciens group]KTF59857.1 hypothetical protein AR691_14090 [Bacillus amyloliquefaciens]
MESKVFRTVREFNKEYSAMREDILKRKGVKMGKTVRLVKAIILVQRINNEWVETTSAKAHMADRVKLYEGLGAEFKLKALG